MPTLVADTSGLVSLGVVTDANPTPLECCLDCHDLIVPQTVVAELRETASYNDTHGAAARTALDARVRMQTESVTLDDTFPLEDGENAAVQLANERDADLLLCDEFTQLGLIHASLADTRLVTTPTTLSLFTRRGRLNPADAVEHLETIATVRSWETNSYVQRARSLLEDQ